MGPEHNGKIHFLEVVLALLQRITGIISEEQIMATLLKYHPKFIKSIKSMPAITGSSADAFVRQAIMTTLHKGLEDAGVVVDDDAAKEGDDAEGEPVDDSFPFSRKSRSATPPKGGAGGSAKRRSICGRKSICRNAEKAAAKQKEAQERHRRDSVLNYMAAQRAELDELAC